MVGRTISMNLYMTSLMSTIVVNDGRLCILALRLFFSTCQCRRFSLS